MDYIIQNTWGMDLYPGSPIYAKILMLFEQDDFGKLGGINSPHTNFANTKDSLNWCEDH